MSTTHYQKEKDLEKDSTSKEWVEDSDASLGLGGDGKYGWLQRRLNNYGVEARGIQPVPYEERTDTHYSKIFFIWFSSNCNILSFSAGTLGPAIFGLGLRDTCLIILFFNLLCCIPPAYLTTWGPKLGMRQMIISRYSFGYYGVILPCILNLIVMIGFSTLNGILGGQTLASVANGNLSWTVGIVIIAVVSLLVSFCGYKVLNWYERVAWIPVVVSFVVALGVGGKHLYNPPPAEPATAAQVLSFASTMAGFTITYSALSSDFTTYLKADVSSWKIFTYSYLGFLLPIVPLQVLGAAVAVAAPSVDSWATGYEGGNVGGLLEAMLSPAKGFGKFLTVLLSLSVAGNMAATFYSISLNLQILGLKWLRYIPRWGMSIVAAAIVIILAIVGQHKFYETLTNFLGLIGYWASSFAAIVLIEHLYFRRSSYVSHLGQPNYDPAHYDQPKALPTGISALFAFIASFGLVIPCMDQVWFVGPIAEKGTGDIGFEVAFFLGGILYFIARTIEVKVRGRL